MKNVIMGTAGHIDHGKTTLVKALTGIDTDRLEEEKRRGMTIELGFAPLKLPSGKVISIVDVPGHEKFIKSMVAGVTGIDFVMLVVAADEGVMPQTLEHIHILSLLNIKSGAVALTKSDLVEEDWLELVMEDIRKALEGTTLEKSEILPVSSLTGKGMDNLLEKLEQLTLETSKSRSSELFRLPIDRIFTMSGHGTVITGTVSGGEISKGMSVELLPSGQKARIRGIQVHNQEVERAAAGDRCALNLVGVEKGSLRRGDVAALPGMLHPANLVDAVLHGVEDIHHNQRVHVNVGTKEALARVRVVADDGIPAGGKGYVQLRFEEPVVILRGDRFIIRSYSPVTTIGGGWILQQSVKNRSRLSQSTVQAMTIEEQGGLKDLLCLMFEESGKIWSAVDLWNQLFIPMEEIQAVLDTMVREKLAVYLDNTCKYYGINAYASTISRIEMLFDQMVQKAPYRYRIDKEEIKSKVFPEMDGKEFTQLLNHLVAEGAFEYEGTGVIQRGEKGILRISALKETILVEEYYRKAGLTANKEAGQSGSSVKEINRSNGNEARLSGGKAADASGGKAEHFSSIKSLGLDRERLAAIEGFLIQRGILLQLGDDILVHREALRESLNQIRDIMENQGWITAAQARDALGIARSTAIAILEFLDIHGVTVRVEDRRMPGPHYWDGLYP